MKLKHTVLYSIITMLYLSPLAKAQVIELKQNTTPGEFGGVSIEGGFQRTTTGQSGFMTKGVLENNNDAAPTIQFSAGSIQGSPLDPTKKSFIGNAQMYWQPESSSNNNRFQIVSGISGINATRNSSTFAGPFIGVYAKTPTMSDGMIAFTVTPLQGFHDKGLMMASATDPTGSVKLGKSMLSTGTAISVNLPIDRKGIVSAFGSIDANLIYKRSRGSEVNESKSTVTDKNSSAVQSPGNSYSDLSNTTYTTTSETHKSKVQCTSTDPNCNCTTEVNVTTYGLDRKQTDLNRAGFEMIGAGSLLRMNAGIKVKLGQFAYVKAEVINEQMGYKYKEQYLNNAVALKSRSNDDLMLKGTIGFTIR